jgi:N-acetylmuramoyl-L-alanine amidase
VLSKDGRRSLPTTVVNEQDFVALDDLAAMFQLTVREDALGAITVSYKGKTIVLTLDQALASVSGRLISLPAPPARGPAPGRRWLVPAEFINRALALVYDAKLDLRRPSRLLVVGDLRVPRVQMRYESVGAGGRLTIDATPRATSTVTQDNERVTIKFDADGLDVANTFLQFSAPGVVSAVRVADATTVVVDLGPRFGGFKASSQPIDNAMRLVIDLAAAQTDNAPPPAAAASPPGPAPDIVALTQVQATIRTIAIDPGHGGDEAGAKGAGGAKEKDITLAVARRIKAAVEARLGIRVLLTRDDDRNVPVDERTALANNSKADLFISLHANASLRTSMSGASLYSAAFLGDAGRVARASHAPERVPAFGGGLRDIEFVPWDFAQIGHVEQSSALAKLLEEQFHDRIPLTARPIDSAPLRVLESVNMPAVLVEMGYLTNPDQEKQLAGAEFQNTFVQAVIDAVLKFRDLLDERRRSAANGAAR